MSSWMLQQHNLLLCEWVKAIGALLFSNISSTWRFGREHKTIIWNAFTTLEWCVSMRIYENFLFIQKPYPNHDFGLSTNRRRKENINYQLLSPIDLCETLRKYPSIQFNSGRNSIESSAHISFQKKVASRLAIIILMEARPWTKERKKNVNGTFTFGWLVQVSSSSILGLTCSNYINFIRSCGRRRRQTEEKFSPNIDHKLSFAAYNTDMQWNGNTYVWHFTYYHV